MTPVVVIPVVQLPPLIALALQLRRELTVPEQSDFQVTHFWVFHGTLERGTKSKLTRIADDLSRRTNGNVWDTFSLI